MYLPRIIRAWQMLYSKRPVTNFRYRRETDIGMLNAREASDADLQAFKQGKSTQTVCQVDALYLS